MKKLAIYMAAMAAMAAFAEEPQTGNAAVEEKEPVEGEVREVMMGDKKVKVYRENGEWVLDTNKESGRGWTNDVAVAHKADDEFLDFNGEKLSWGAVDKHIDLLMMNAPLSLSPQATAEDVEKATVVARGHYAARLGEMYVRNALLAQEARKMGLSVEEGEIRSALTNAVKRLSRKNRDTVLEAVLDPESYFWRNQENFLLTREYRAAKLMEPVEVSAEEVAAFKAECAEGIRRAQAMNATLRPKMEKWLEEIKAGTRDFNETAEDESDSPDTDADGTLGEFDREEAEDFLAEDIRKFAFAASTNTLSEVMETPTEYHIVKVLARKYDAAEDDGSIPAGPDGVKAPTSVTLAAIVKEKFEEPDMPTDEEAAEVVKKRKLGERLVAAQEEVLKRAKIKSVYPVRIRAGKDKAKRAMMNRRGPFRRAKKEQE